MSLVEKKMYTAICDNCKQDICEGQEYSCWCLDGIKNLIDDSEWHITEQGDHYCPDCWSYDDNDEIIINEKRKK